MKKILILTSNPRNDLKLDREIKDLKNVIKRSKNQSQFEIKFELEVHPEELQDLLLEHEPRIVHFCGHGTGERGLVLENHRGQEQIISTEALSNLFSLFDRSCECVVLNACYSEVQAQAIVGHINYVIGMSHEIRDDAAIAFATGFYRALGWGRSINEAYNFGRNAIQIQLAQNNTSRSRSGLERKMVVDNAVARVDLPEDLKPVLKQKSPLTPFPESATATRPQSSFPPELIAAVREEERYKQYREQARETWDEFGQSSLVKKESISQNEYRQRKTLLNKVKQFWIEGFLMPSLYANAAIDLDWQNSPDAVLRPFEGMADIPVELDESFEELQTTEILNQTGQGKTLLILGEPGSGKTITLLQLAEKLVSQSEADLTKPIPVVFNLSSWAQKQQSIAKWLIEEFKDKYQVPKIWSKLWIKQEQLVLLLDGLDEVRADRRDACVRALNQFIATHNITEMVVCSRVKDYQALNERLQLSSALCIKPLSQQQVYSFLTKAGDSLAGLKTLLQQDRELEQFAQTPLILNIMSIAYQGWSSDDLLRQFRTSSDRYRHLFDSYIHRMLNRPARVQSRSNFNLLQYPQEKTLHWLSWLAKTMVEESKIIFLIETMQPSWLQSRSEIRDYHFSNFLLGNLGVALIFVPMFGLMVGFENLSTSGKWLYYWLLGGLLVGAIIVGLSKEIMLFEQMSWSWQKAKSKIASETLIGLIFGLIFGLCISPIFGLVRGLILFGSLGMVVNLLNSGSSSVEVKQKTVPNQGVWNSAKNALKLGLVEGICVGLTIILINSIAGYPLKAANVKSVGLMLALIIGVKYGATTCIQHFNLRRILYRKGRIPWNYARFLNYATDRLLMKKVGGGYVFYHRMLMEHFAQRYQVSRKPIFVTPRQIDLSLTRTNARTKVRSSKTNDNIASSLTSRSTFTDTKPTIISSNTAADAVTSPEDPVQFMICRSCNHQNPNTGKFCIKCGNKLT